MTRTPVEATLKVGDAMSTGAEAIRPGVTVRAAAARMCAQGIGYFPVVDRGRLLGILTDRDIVCRVVAEERDPDATKIREIMSKAVAFCFEDEDLGKAVQLMEQNRVRRLPVLDRREHLVGILSITDIAQHAPQRLTAEILEAVSRDVPLSVTINPADNILR
jgi:CBS domain-containing protein